MAIRNQRSEWEPGEGYQPETEIDSEMDVQVDTSPGDINLPSEDPETEIGVIPGMESQVDTQPEDFNPPEDEMIPVSDSIEENGTTSIEIPQVSDETGLFPMVQPGDEPELLPASQTSEELESVLQTQSSEELDSTQQIQPSEEPELLSTIQAGEEPVLVSTTGASDATISIPMSPVNEEPISITASQASVEDSSLPSAPDNLRQVPIRKIALVLFGNGARGAFQVGAEKYAREVKGYHWDIIAGVSVGAINGAMIAMQRYTRLLKLWDSISDEKYRTMWSSFISFVKLMLGSRSFYSNTPLKKLLEHEFEAGRINNDLRVGAVSLASGGYIQFTRESLELSRAILASASIPVVWTGVEISPEQPGKVDGGASLTSPMADVLDQEPDEIIIISCNPRRPSMKPGATTSMLSVGLHAIGTMQNEILAKDIEEFLRINDLVEEAEKQGCLLHHPRTGKLLKYYPCQVIEPECELGGVSDFSQAAVQASLKAGVRRAREVLGRP